MTKDLSVFVEGLVNGSTYSETVPTEDIVSTVAGLVLDVVDILCLIMHAQITIINVSDTDKITVTKHVIPERNIVKCKNVGKSMKMEVSVIKHRKKQRILPLLVSNVDVILGPIVDDG